MNGQKIKLVIKNPNANNQSGAAPGVPVHPPQPPGNDALPHQPQHIPRAQPEPSATTSQGTAGAPAGSKPTFKFKVTLGPKKDEVLPSAPAFIPPPATANAPIAAAGAAASPPQGFPKRPRAPDGSTPIPGPKRPKLAGAGRGSRGGRGPRPPRGFKSKPGRIPKNQIGAVPAAGVAAMPPPPPFAGIPDEFPPLESTAGGGSASPGVFKLKVKKSRSLGAGVGEGLPPFSGAKVPRRRGRRPKGALPGNVGDRPPRPVDDVSYNVNIKPREYSLRNITSSTALDDEFNFGGSPDEQNRTGPPPPTTTATDGNGGLVGTNEADQYTMIPAAEVFTAPAMPLPAAPVRPPTKEDFERVLTRVTEKDQRGLFRVPVTNDVAPGYTDIISNPMDLGTMRQKLADDAYTTWEDFDADLMLIFDNALLYNPQGDPVWRTANQMKAASIRITNTVKLGKTSKGAGNAIARKKNAAQRAAQRAERDQARLKARAEQRAAHEAKILKRAGVASSGSFAADDEENIRNSYRRRTSDAAVLRWGGLGGGTNAKGVAWASVGRVVLQPTNPAPSGGAIAASITRFAAGLSGKVRELVLGRAAAAAAAPQGPLLKVEEVKQPPAAAMPQPQAAAPPAPSQPPSSSAAAAAAPLSLPQNPFLTASGVGMMTMPSSMMNISINPNYYAAFAAQQRLQQQQQQQQQKPNV